MLRLMCHLTQNCNQQRRNERFFCCHTCPKKDTCKDRCLNTPDKCKLSYVWNQVKGNTRRCLVPNEMNCCTGVVEDDKECANCRWNVKGDQDIELLSRCVCEEET